MLNFHCSKLLTSVYGAMIAYPTFLSLLTVRVRTGGVYVVLLVPLYLVPCRGIV